MDVRKNRLETSLPILTKYHPSLPPSLPPSLQRHYKVLSSLDVVSGVPLYSYHPSPVLFIRVSLFDPRLVSRVVSVLESEVVGGLLGGGRALQVGKREGGRGGYVAEITIKKISLNSSSSSPSLPPSLPPSLLLFSGLRSAHSFSPPVLY